MCCRNYVQRGWGRLLSVQEAEREEGGWGSRQGRTPGRRCILCVPSKHDSRSRCDSCVVVDCDCAGAKKSAASKTAGWRYIVISLFKDYERVRRLYPHLHPTREDDCDTNNCCEAFHSVMKPCRCAAPHACLFCGCHMRGAHVHVQVGAWIPLCASGLGAPRDMGVCWLSRQGCSPKGHQRESHCPSQLVLSPCVLLRNE